MHSADDDKKRDGAGEGIGDFIVGILGAIVEALLGASG